MNARKTILINEDEVPLAMALAGAFRREGFEVEVTHAVEDAQEVMSKKRIDLVITDLNLPGTRGDRQADGAEDVENPPPSTPR